MESINFNIYYEIYAADILKTAENWKKKKDLSAYKI